MNSGAISMARKPLEKQVADLKVDIKKYATTAHQKRAIRDAKLKKLKPSQMHAFCRLMKAQAKMGISDGDFMNLARLDLLPETIQSLYDFSLAAAPPDLQSDERAASSEPLSKPKRPRFDHTSWQCQCGSGKTLWYKTHLDVKDCNQIYCEACHKLCGWGSESQMKLAIADGKADRLIITNSFERYEFSPPLLSEPPESAARTRIRAKQTQR